MIQTKRKNLLLDMIAIGLYGLLLAIAFLAFFAVVWYRATYGNTGFDSVLFTLTGGLNGVQGGLVGSFLLPVKLFHKRPVRLTPTMLGDTERILL